MRQVVRFLLEVILCSFGEGWVSMVEMHTLVAVGMRRGVVALACAAAVVSFSGGTGSAQTAKGGAKVSSAKANKPVSGKQAVAMIEALPDVKKWSAAIKKLNTPKNTAHVELDRTEGGEHIVHVYEMVMDTPDEGHTATFNWYHVNIKTGKISKEF